MNEHVIKPDSLNVADLTWGLTEKPFTMALGLVLAVLDPSLFGGSPS